MNGDRFISAPLKSQDASIKVKIYGLDASTRPTQYATTSQSMSKINGAADLQKAPIPTRS